jgi:hypothetical protein
MEWRLAGRPVFQNGTLVGLDFSGPNPDFPAPDWSFTGTGFLPL